MNSKLKNGYQTEELFILECLKNDIPISRPIYNIEPYDFIVEVDNKFYSVQVKKSWKDKKGLNIVCLKNSYPRSNKVNVVSKNLRVDFMAIITEDKKWYIIPREKIEHIKSNIAVSQKGNYKKYLYNFKFDK